MDTLTPRERSERMGRIRAKNTRPELQIRRMLHARGFRYRLHRRDLPGSPDLVFPGKRKVIFVHGCFWHRHTCQTGRRAVRTRSEYWKSKFERNVSRDLRKEQELAGLGWDVLVVWECEVKETGGLRERLIDFLGPNRPQIERKKHLR